MNTSLNIKNPEAVAALRQLGAHYGTNCTQAIVQAAEDIIHESIDDRRARSAARLDALSARFWAATDKVPGELTDAGMYDDAGLSLW